MSETEFQKSKEESLKLPESVAGLPLRYELIELLGQGGMALVYKAMDRPLIRTVAIKVLLNTDKVEKTVERFTREAKLLAGLSHPNIVKLLSWGRTESSDPYLVMEYLEGNSLHDEIGDGKRLSPERLHQIFDQILAGLAYAHEQKIVHRDLKPSNIIICRSEDMLSAKILDFGIARSEEAGNEGGRTLTKTNAMLGSPAYMSPEQCKGERADKLSDIYSLGCIMYESLSGEKPFSADSPLELMYKHMNEKAPTLEALCADGNARRLGKLIDSCLEKDPAKRPQSCADLQNELSEIFKNRIDTGNILAAKSSASTKPTLPMLIAVASVVMLVIAALVFLPQSTRRGRLVTNQIKQEQKKRDRNQLDFLLNQCDTLELRTREAAGEDKRTKASELFRHIQTIIVFYRSHQQYDLAEQYAQKLEPLSKIIDFGFENYKAKYYMDLAACYVPKEQKAKKIQCLEKGMACRINDLQCRAYLAHLRGVCYLENGELKNAEKCLKIVTESALDNEIQTLEYSQTGVNTKTRNLSVRLFNELTKDLPEKLQNCKDYAAMLRIYLLIAEHLIEHGNLEQSENLSKSISRLRSRLSNDAPGYKQLMDRSNNVLKRLSLEIGSS